MNSEEELDKIYHSIPDWVKKQFPNQSLSERIKNGFEKIDKQFTEEILKNSSEKEKNSAFIKFIFKKYGLNFEKEYLDFLFNNKDSKKTVLPLDN